jgi:hypothetical protein
MSLACLLPSHASRFPLFNNMKALAKEVSKFASEPTSIAPVLAKQPKQQRLERVLHLLLPPLLFRPLGLSPPQPNFTQLSVPPSNVKPSMDQR